MVLKPRARSWIPRAAALGVVLLMPVSTASTQQPTGAGGTSAAPAQGRGQSNRPPSPPEVTVDTATGTAAEVFALEKRLDAAIVKGDTATVDGILAKDAVFFLDDRWTTDGRSAVLGRAAFLRDVAARGYLLHDLDREKIEMHPDVAITYGRHVDLRKRAGQTPATEPRHGSSASMPGEIRAGGCFRTA